jgi:hypothetical protein
MDKYITQLIEDIHAAKANIPLPEEPSATEEPLDFWAEMEALENQADSPKMSELLGLEKIQFPPAERLTETQMKAVIEAMCELWTAFNFDINVPENIPTELLYTVVVNELDTFSDYVFPEQTSEKIEINFCSYNYTLCQLGEYCHCLEFKDEWEKEEEEWNSKSEEEKDAFVADFKAQVSENQRKWLEGDLPF